jgi:hypothetical protein
MQNRWRATSVPMPTTVSSQRAEGVAAALIAAEPDLADRVDAIGHGEDELVDSDCLGNCPSNRVLKIGLSN